MDEFDSVSVSTFEAASLAAKLAERSADGWEVVAIVPAGSDITAYVKRKAGADAATTSFAESSATEPTATEPGPVSEPAGWGTAPESTPAASSAESTWGQAASTGSGWGSGSGSSGGWGSGGATPASTAAPSAPAQQPATPAVPAGWYQDPALRYELRYWDGSAWTEHVSRNGQQYTDPPVA